MHAEFRTRLEATPREVLDWHLRPGAFERLVPPWERVEVAGRTGAIDDGGEVTLRVGFGPFSLDWVARHRDFRPGESFVDDQVRGPFARWTHTHRVESDGDGAVLVDSVDYDLPFGPLGRLAAPFVERRLAKMFEHRHRTTQQDLEGAGPRMRVAVTGASGLLGSALVARLGTRGHDPVTLVRRAASGPDEIRWDPGTEALDAEALEGVDAVVHLAGENVAGGRWTPERKARIRASRTQGTRLVAETLARMTKPPRVLVCASAVGYYGDTGSAVVDESAPPGSDFLAEVCQAWEASAAPARAAGIRVVHLRFGVILTPGGGALAKMLTPFRMCAGGVIGSGDQLMSWISLDDACGAVFHALTNEELVGPVNAVAPAPVTNRTFTKALGAALGRPTVLPMPAFAARLAFGEMADAMLLASCGARPSRLVDTGYTFQDPDLEPCLRRLLGRD